jgi:subtilase family serine protease
MREEIAVGSVRARARLATAIAVITCTSLFAFGPAVPSSAAPAGTTASRALYRACGDAAPGQFRCFAQWRASGSGASAAAGVRPAVALPGFGYGPPDIASAYQLDTTLGAGQTVAIVDAFDNPKVEANLKAYRAAWGLPPCTTANGCFRKVNQRGGSTPPFPDPGWGVEIALDVQAVSAACPSCKILLVEANVPSFVAIGKAVNTAVRLGADVVSNSYGADEFNGILDFGATYYTHPGVAQVAASGDFGFGPASFPAVWGNVIAAGGTTLRETSPGVWHEKAWGGAGSGCSAWVPKPTWQHDTHCLMQTVADLSAVADPRTGFAVYDTFGLGPDNGWIQVGGTSLSTPLIAGMIGLAGNADQLSDPSYIYAHQSGLQDVVGGSNGFCGGDYLCTGKKGYDAPTGLGSPRGVSAL